MNDFMNASPDSLFYLGTEREKCLKFETIYIHVPGLLIRVTVYWKTIFFVSHPKHMLWVLKRTVSMRQFF